MHAPIGFALVILLTGCVSSPKSSQTSLTHFQNLRAFWVYVGHDQPFGDFQQFRYPTNPEDIAVWERSSQWTCERLLDPRLPALDQSPGKLDSDLQVRLQRE